MSKLPQGYELISSSPNKKFVSEMSKDVHMENCMIADGPSSLDSSLDAPVRALLR